MKKFFMFFVVFVLLMSVPVLAKGGSSGGTVVKPKVMETETEPLDCESFATIKERVKCRLENGQQEETTPEPCRQLAIATKCVQYYKDSIECYDLNGKEKDQCFKTRAGFTTKDVKAERARGEPSLGAIRYYALALLYDLEERAEDAVDENELTADEGAQLISEIIEIKVKILGKAPVSEIKSDVAELRAQWPSEIR